MSGLKAAFAGDPAAVQILPPTPFGLVQISRQRLGKSLRERLQRPCPTCSGNSSITSLEASVERMLSDLSERDVSPAPANFRTAVDLYSYLMSDGAEPFRNFFVSHGMPQPIVEPDDALAPGSYRMLGA